MSEQEVYLIGHKEKEFRLNHAQFQIFDEFIAPIDFVKIGISNNPQERLNNMKPSTPHELELITTIEAESAKLVESRLHSIYYPWRHNGEWFYLPKDETDALRRIDWLNDDDIEGVYSMDINEEKELDETIYDQLMEVRE